MNMNDRSQQVKAALAASVAIAEAIRDSNGIPSGHLYAMLMDRMSLDTYNQIITILKQAGLVKEESFFLTYIGPKP